MVEEMELEFHTALIVGLYIYTVYCVIFVMQCALYVRTLLHL